MQTNFASEFDAHLVFGPDAAAFLQNQLAADLKILRDQEAVWTCWCDPRGNIRWMGHVIRENNDRWWLLGDQAFTNPLHKLRMFVLRSKVDVQRAAIVAAQCGQNQTVTPPPIGGENRFYIDAFRSVVLREEEPRAADTDACSTSVWRAMGALRGECQLPAAICMKQIPQNLGMREGTGFSLRKGCYPGQEIVSRVHYRGRPPRRLHTSIAHSSPGDAEFSAPLPASPLRISQALRPNK